MKKVATIIFLVFAISVTTSSFAASSSSPSPSSSSFAKITALYNEASQGQLTLEALQRNGIKYMVVAEKTGWTHIIVSLVYQGRGYLGADDNNPQEAMREALYRILHDVKGVQ